VHRRGSTVASSHASPIERADELTDRARRMRRRGESRRALVALREACLLDERCASRWLLYARVLVEAGKLDDAERAMKQSLYRREQTGDEKRANVVRTLIARLGEGRGSGTFRRASVVRVA
jgi:thioredoxin-like negative regulator of GroEL